MSRVKDALKITLGILFVAVVAWGVVSGIYGDIQERRWCTRNYAECAHEQIQVALEASTNYASWIEGPVVDTSALRGNHRAISHARVLLDEIKPPAQYEDIHARLLEAMKRMDGLTDLVAPPMGINRDESIDPLVANIMECQEELDQIQAEILQLSGTGIETPSVERATPAPATPSSAVITHTVQPGDTLAKIAAEFGVTVEAIVEANDIEDPSLINVGQVLVIPKP